MIITNVRFILHKLFTFAEYVQITKQFHWYYLLDAPKTPQSR